jgi:hypothetical protein
MSAACQVPTASSIVVGSCTLNRPTVLRDSTNHIEGDARASCSGLNQRTLSMNVKVDFPNFPDAVIATDTDSGKLVSYHAWAQDCDGGNTRDYYSEAWFSAGEPGDVIQSGRLNTTSCKA